MIIRKLNILILFFVLTSSLFAQNSVKFYGSPFIRNYSQEEYNAGSQIWDIEQDKNGFMYFGCNKKMLVFDGSSWREYQVDNKSVIRSIEIADDGKIFVGASNEFGYFKPNKLGELEYFSLSKNIPDTIKIFQDIWQLHITKKAVYFTALNYIFIWQNEKIDVIKTRTYSHNTFEINGKIYANTKNGFCVLNNNKFDTLPNCDILKTPSVFFCALKLDNNNIFITTRFRGLFIYNLKDEKLSQLKLSDSLKSYINENIIYKSVILSNNRIALCTFHGGILIIDKNGNFLRVINKHRGLVDNSVYSMFFDKDNNLWAGVQGGICRIDLSLPAQIFNNNQNISSYVITKTYFQNDFYVATIDKLYYLTKYKLKSHNDNHSFKRVPIIGGAWKFLHIKDKLLTFGYSGVAKINNRKASLVNNYEGIELTAAYNKKYADKLFIGLNNGFGVTDLFIEKGNPNIKTGNLIRFKEISEDVRYITFDSLNNIWLSTYTSGPIYIRFNSDSLKNYNVTKFHNNNGLPKDINEANVKNIDNKINILTEKGIYKPVFTKNGHDSLIKFEHNKKWGKKISNDSLNVDDIIKISKSRYIIIGDDIAYLTIYNDSVQYNPKPFTRFNHFSEITLSSDSTINIGTANSFIVYNINNNKDYDKKFDVIIRKIIVGKDSVIFNGYFSENDTITKKQPSNFYPVLKHKNNNITFIFSSNFYEEHEKNLYKCKLEGFENEWTSWKQDNEITYTNIPEGEYVLKIKAKNVYQTESYISEFKFKILPPWYRTWCAYTAYVILFVLIVFFIIKIYTARLKKKNIELERIVSQRTEEIRQQNEELQSQAEELQSQAEELKKLSIVASETDNAVIIMDTKGRFEWFNQAFTKLYGYTFNEFINKFSNILEISENPNIKKYITDCVKKQQTHIYESKMKAKSGEEIWVQTTITPIIGYLDKVEKIVAIDSDIRKLKKAEKQISDKNYQLNIRNKQITSSINYAKTIQQAILPIKEEINRFFDNFIIFRPKDIVSGDFYWFTQINEMKFIAVVDCTGHGVPGAFMSMIGNTLLNEIVKNQGVYDPKNILIKLNDEVIKSLKQTQTDNQDGMDVCFCKIEKNSSEKIQLTFCGAKRPLFYYSNNQKQLKRLKGDRKTIGGYVQNPKVKFSNQQILISKKDIIYLSTDGFVDQNNNERKRFGSTKFKNIIVKNVDKSLIIQKQIFEKELEIWQDNQPQRDDITLIGVKI